MTVRDNFDRLFYEPDAIARSARYTHAVDDRHILRTHMTSAIPALLEKTKADRLLVCPGLVFRRDVVDRLHVGAPHQLDLWLIREGRLKRADLLDLVQALMAALLPGREWRATPALHSYTVNGLQIDLRHEGDWVELLECGEAHPWLLEESGLPCRHWSGLALGLGLDRLAMLIKGLADIRLLRATDPRIARQMSDLSPYRPVSQQPATRRDLSIAVTDPDWEPIGDRAKEPIGDRAKEPIGDRIMELIGDRIRDIAGDKADWVEDVALLSAVPFADLPVLVRDRLGMQAGQTNLLIRVTLRRMDGSIAKAEGNALYEALYAGLHQGSRGYGGRI